MLAFTSCTSSELPETPGQTDGNVISISRVSQSAFHTEAGTRAAYSDSYATTFEEGDRLGLILVDNNGAQVANAPFSYTEDGSWNNDRNQRQLPNIAKVVAYYPYNERLASTVNSADLLRSASAIALDQSEREDFAAADLLVCELDNPGANLHIHFTHAFSMLRFSAKGSVNAGGRDYEYGIALDGLKVNVGNDVYTPHYMNGSYLVIVKNGTELQPELFKYTYRRFGEDRATKTITSARNTPAGTIFSFPCPSDGTAVAGLSAGDYYCTAEDEATVILPAGAAEIPAGLECHGIVLHAMDNDEFASFAGANDLAVAEYPGVQGNHGLVIALGQGNILLSGYTAANDEHKAFLESIFAEQAESGNTDIPQGYKLTRLMAAAYAGGNAGVTFTGMDGFGARLPRCTDWYVPSFHELKYIVRGEANLSSASLAGQEMLNRQIAAAGGIQLEGNMPSVSYRHGEGFCIMQDGNEMGWHGVPDGEKCRVICAF